MSYKFLARLLSFYIPFPKVRRKVRNYILRKDIQFIIDTHYTEVYLKFNEFKNKLDIVDTVILGSSHAAAGFVPSIYSNKSFNLASSSQDLYYSYHLVKFSIEKVKNLKSIILFFSVFSPGFTLQKTSESYKCVSYNLLYNIPYEFNPDKTLISFYNKLCKYNLSNKKFINSNGYIEQTCFADSSYPVQKRVYTHLRENKRSNSRIKYLMHIIEECKKYNIKLIVVISPARSDYKKFMPDAKDLFNDLYQLNDKLRIINLYDNTSFEDGDFGDFDHLNKKGAIKLTKILKDILLNKRANNF